MSEIEFPGKDFTAINLNSCVSFKPTEKFKQVYQSRMQSLIAGIPLENKFSTKLKLGENGFCAMQFHEFLYTFGDLYFLGNDDLVINVFIQQKVG